MRFATQSDPILDDDGFVLERGSVNEILGDALHLAHPSCWCKPEVMYLDEAFDLVEHNGRQDPR